MFTITKHEPDASLTSKGLGAWRVQGPCQPAGGLWIVTVRQTFGTRRATILCFWTWQTTCWRERCRPSGRAWTVYSVFPCQTITCQVLTPALPTGHVPNHWTYSVHGCQNLPGRISICLILCPYIMFTIVLKRHGAWLPKSARSHFNMLDPVSLHYVHHCAKTTVLASDLELI